MLRAETVRAGATLTEGFAVGFTTLAVGFVTLRETGFLPTLGIATFDAVAVS
jgi:hypothetical protein